MSWLVAAMGVLQPALLVLLVPRRWLGRAMAIWLALPVAVWAFVVLRELATRPAPPELGRNLALGFGLVMTTYGAAWVILSGLGFLLGRALRRRLRPEEARAAQPSGAAPAAVAHPPPRAASPTLPVAAVVLPNGAAREVLDSPDGRIRVDLAVMEWFATHWVRAPRVEDRRSGQVLLDLWGTDWDAAVSFPAPGRVELGLRRYRGPGAWSVVLDLDAGSAVLRDPAPRQGGTETLALAALPARLEALSAAAATAARAGGRSPYAPSPGPFAAWRIAVLLAVGAGLAIAALVALTPDRRPPQVLDRVPGFVPPPIPQPPRMPEAPRR